MSDEKVALTLVGWLPDFGYARSLARRHLLRQGQSISEVTPLVRQSIPWRKWSAFHQGAKVDEMADEMGGSETTIHRILKLFQRTGFPLAGTTEDHGRKKWHVNADRSQLGLSFAVAEGIALYLTRHLMEPLAGTMFREAVQRAFKMVLARLGRAAVLPGKLDPGHEVLGGAPVQKVSSVRSVAVGGLAKVV